MRLDGLVRVSHDEPCEICKKPDWCCRLTKFHWCMRLENDQPHKKGGWLYPRDAASISLPPPPRPARMTDSQAAEHWTPIAKACYRRGASRRADLAATLKVDEDALVKLKVGYGEFSGRLGWTFPERNARGWIIGISLRLVECLRNGKNKLMVKGSKRGLIYAENWMDHPGVVWLVEGASDVAAGMSLGLSVIGRPSNTGGSDMLAAMLRNSNRKIVVMGERDKRSEYGLLRANPAHNPRCDGCQTCWPGLYGANQTAKLLSDLLGRTIQSKLCPQGFKDLREFLKSLDDSERETYGQILQAGIVPRTTVRRA